MKNEEPREGVADRIMHRLLGGENAMTNLGAAAVLAVGLIMVWNIATKQKPAPEKPSEAAEPSPEEQAERSARYQADAAARRAAILADPRHPEARRANLRAKQKRETEEERRREQVAETERRRRSREERKKDEIAKEEAEKARLAPAIKIRDEARARGLDVKLGQAYSRSALRRLLEAPAERNHAYNMTELWFGQNAAEALERWELCVVETYGDITKIRVGSDGAAAIELDGWRHTRVLCFIEDRAQATGLRRGQRIYVRGLVATDAKIAKAQQKICMDHVRIIEK